MRCETGAVIGRSSRSRMTHLAPVVLGFPEDDGLRLAAHYLCGGSSISVKVVPRDAGELCGFCIDTELGPGVYRCFNAAGVVIYIGATAHYLKRIKQHETESPWWPEVADVTVERYRSKPDAFTAERTAIYFGNPVHNVTHRSHPVDGISYLPIRRGTGVLREAAA